MTQMARPAVVAAVVMVVGLSVAGCGGGPVTATTAAGDEVTVVVRGDSRTGMDALLPGRLAVVGDSLGIDGLVVVWPEGTELAGAEELTVDVPGHGTYALGDEIELGGGRIDGSPELGGATLPASCADQDVWLAS